jgi:sugar phosphate isomerase/epimerase
MNRRTFLAVGAALGFGSRLTAAPSKAPMGLVIHSYAFRSRKPAPPEYPPVATPLDFLAEAARVGAAGVQTNLAAKGSDPKAVRDYAEAHGLFVEGSLGLPKTDSDAARFSAELEASKTAGAGVVRTVCLSGRRYETFDSLEQFKKFADDSWQALRRAEPIAARHKVTLAVENHKDWRTDEMLGWLTKLSSEWVRACLDTGNSVALLEDPLATAEALAPFAATTHLKDMGVAEYADGFLLSEVPFGDGFLDLPKIVSVVRTANPRVRLNLEMITRDPLKVPCLTPKYWATLPTVPAKDLAAALARVRAHKFPRPLPTTSDLDPAGQLKAEARNIDRCLAYAAEKLGRI